MFIRNFWNDRRLAIAGLLSKNRTTVNYSYDYLGNCIKESGGSSTVDMEYAVTGEMTKLTKAESGTTTLTQTNVYDHNGQRIERTENSSELDYYYDQGVMVYTIDGSDVCDSNVLSEDGAVIGTYRSGTYYNYLKDIQGSTTNIIKEDGTLSAAYDYTDFGETTAITGAGFDNQICYTGGVYDKETGLYYLNARYYDPGIGRFISQDSYRGELNDPGQWHLYAYCANNPINFNGQTMYYNSIKNLKKKKKLKKIYLLSCKGALGTKSVAHALYLASGKNASVYACVDSVCYRTSKQGRRVVYHPRYSLEYILEYNATHENQINMFTNPIKKVYG